MPRLCKRGGQRGREETGSNPTDRGRPGSKRHVITEANGIPLAVRLTAANVHDSRVFEDLIDAVPPIRQRRGRPRKRPAKLHADKAYDVPRCREALRRRRIKARPVCTCTAKGRPASRRAPTCSLLLVALGRLVV